jgi:hypothetical protein
MQSYYPIGNARAIHLPPQAPPALDPIATEPTLRQFVKSYDRVWVLPVAIEQADPDRFVQRWLNEHWYRSSDSQDVISYFAPPPASLSLSSVPLHFGRALELKAAEVATTTLETGSAVLSTLTWHAAQPLNSDCKLSWRRSIKQETYGASASTSRATPEQSLRSGLRDNRLSIGRPFRSIRVHRRILSAADHGPAYLEW